MSESTEMLSMSRQGGYHHTMKRRLVLLTFTVFFLLLLTSVAAAASPEQSLQSFIYRLNQSQKAPSLEALYRKNMCEIIDSQLWHFYFFPELIYLSDGEPASYSVENRLKMCAATIAVYNGYAEEAGNPQWQRSKILRIVKSSRRGGRALLRVRMAHYFKNRADNYRTTVSVLLKRSGDQWQLISLKGLLQLLPGRQLLLPPQKISGWDKYYAKVQNLSAQFEQALSRSLERRAAAKSPIQPSLLSCGGSRSEAQDTANDVFWASGYDPIPNQELASIDLHSGSLHVDQGVLCLQLTFAGPVNPETLSGLSFKLYSKGAYDTELTSFGVSVGESMAWGVLEKESSEPLYIPLRLALAGNELQLQFNWSDVAGYEQAPFKNLPQRFRWAAEVWEADIAGSSADDTLAWMDTIPDDLTISDTTGIEHNQ